MFFVVFFNLLSCESELDSLVIFLLFLRMFWILFIVVDLSYLSVVCLLIVLVCIILYVKVILNVVIWLFLLYDNLGVFIDIGMYLVNIIVVWGNLLWEWRLIWIFVLIFCGKVCSLVIGFWMELI